MSNTPLYNLIREGLNKTVLLNEMASYYKFKGDPEEARQAVHDVKEKLKPGILRDALDKLEKDGEIDLPELADERGVDPAVYSHPSKQKVFNDDLKDYLEPGKSPFRQGNKETKKKAAAPKQDFEVVENPDGTISVKSEKKSKRDYPDNFEIIENPDGTMEIKEKEIAKPLPITKDTSLFDKKQTLNKSLKLPSDPKWSEKKKAEGDDIRKKWRFSMVDKGIMTYDEVYAKFKIVPERIKDYEKELEKFIPVYTKKMAAIPDDLNENAIPKYTMKKSEFKQFIREEIKRTLKESTDPSPEVIKQMREWVKDCQWGDLTEEDIDEMSDNGIIQGVKRNYEGGVSQFIKDSNLDETTIVDKTTDLSKVADIAKQEKKDPLTVSTAINQAKTSGKPVTIAEQDIVVTDFVISEPQMEYLKSMGVQQNLKGDVLYFPLSIVHDLQQRESPQFKHDKSAGQNTSFKQGFIDAGTSKHENISKQILGAFIKLLKQSSTDSKGRVFYALKGRLSANNIFYFPNPSKK